MALNVDRSNSDTFYRYKMPRLVAKVEGSGNGIKTVLPNITEVSRSLSRPPNYPLKYFGIELGAQTSIDVKNERYIINGAHDGAKLQDLLDGFIQKFVLCSNCSNPETDLDVQKKKEIVKQRCAACGYQGTVDLKHKLTSFIIKNPPESMGTGAGGGDVAEGGKGGKKGKVSSKTAGRRTGSAKNGTAGAASGVKMDDREASVSSPVDHINSLAGVVEGGAGGSGADVTDFGSDQINVVMGSDELDGVFPEAGSDDLNGNAKVLTNGGGGGGSKLGDDWADEDTSLDAAAASRADQELTGAVRRLALDADAERSEEERLDLFHSFIQARKKETPNVATASFPADVVLKIYAEAERLEVQDKAPLIIAHELFDENCVKQVKLHRALLVRFTFKDKKAQRNLVGGLEQLAGVEQREALLCKVSQIFNALYENDIIDEDVFMAWYDKPSKKFVKLKIAEELREKAAKFITWLKDAEEEESSADEDSGENNNNGEDDNDEENSVTDEESPDEQVAPTMGSSLTEVGKGKLVNKAASVKPPKPAAEDIDIDAI